MARNDYDAVCGGKQQHPDKPAARTAANRTRAEGGRNLRGRLNVYACPFSQPGETHWHVGHESPAQAKRKNPRVRAKYQAA